MKNILITGITGTLGTAVARKLLNKGYTVTGISRDEQKQKQFRYKNDVRLVIGDVSNEESILRAAKGADLIFHFAAMKCIDICQSNVQESYRSNVIGTNNVMKAASVNGSKVAFTSTDKAAEPKNTYGVCKALAEKMVLSYGTGNVVCRYGNVLGSRGSVLNIFKKAILEHNEIRLTHADMTRFWITKDIAADFVIDSAFSKEGLCIPDIKSSYVFTLAKIVANYLNKKPELKIIGMHEAEKLHECLCIDSETKAGKNIYSNDKDFLMTDEAVKEMIYKYMGHL